MTLWIVSSPQVIYKRLLFIISEVLEIGKIFLVMGLKVSKNLLTYIYIYIKVPYHTTKICVYVYNVISWEVVVYINGNNTHRHILLL